MLTVQVFLNKHVDNRTTICPPHLFSINRSGSRAVAAALDPPLITHYVSGKCLCSHLLNCLCLVPYSFTHFECNTRYNSPVFMHYNVDNFLTGVTSNAMTSIYTSFGKL